MPDGRPSDDSGAAIPAADPFGRSDPPVFARTLRPHRSLTRRGGTGVLALVTLGLTLPLLPLLGTRAAWGLLPFLVAALVALYLAIRRSTLDGRLTEELRLWPDLITVVRREPAGTVRTWHANPYWVEPRLRDDARIEKYLTLRGGGREIELGAFLTPGEREALYADLRAALRQLGPVRPGVA